jgi:hypothetical protein
MSKEARRPMKQHVLPCSCIVTEYPGNVNTMMCQGHLRERIAAATERRDIRELIQPNNLDLIGG